MQKLEISETMNERYLGLPVHVDKSKSSVFAYLKDRVWQRIQRWKEKLLLRAGKEVLIKVVAQAIMSLLLPWAVFISRRICASRLVI